MLQFLVITYTQQLSHWIWTTREMAEKNFQKLESTAPKDAYSKCRTPQ
jgi:hypothetical protein